MAFSKPIIRYLGMTDYNLTWEEMKNFTQQRGPEADDQIWITEHPAVFTQGLNGKAEHILNSGDIPVMQTDRGGQVSYHGPGQVLVYCLLDICRLGFGVRALVTHIESAVISFLNAYGVGAQARTDAPGVYVDDAKIAALGLRIRKGCCYHGLSLNVDMDLSPFQRINPCGYENLAVTQLADLNIDISPEQAGHELASHLIGRINRE